MRSQRLLSSLMLLQGKRRITARELARQLDVSMRTVYRDVELLSQSGVPIHMERGPLGGIVLADDYRRELAHFSSDELRALFSTGSGPMADLGMATVEPALQKLRGALSAMQRRAADSSRERLLVDQSRWGRAEQPTAILVRLRKAAESDRRVRLHYRDRSGTSSERIVDPLGLVAKAGVWYLIAREEQKGYRTFRAQRIAAVEELAATFERPGDFDLETYWSASVVTIERQSNETYDAVLRVRSDSVAQLGSFFEANVEREDESGTTMRVRFPSRDVAIVHVLVHADAIEILSPDDLSAAIVDRARAALARLGPNVG
jgi:predicted DNA-binding transcriptional regulator YafY